MYGVLEDQFSPEMSESQATALAAKALLASAQRDSASGNGMDLAVITMENGYRQLTDDELEKVLSSL